MNADAIEPQQATIEALKTKVANLNGEMTIDVIYYLRHQISNDWRYFADLQEDGEAPRTAEQFGEACVSQMSRLRTAEAIQQCMTAVRSWQTVAGLVQPAGRAAAIEKVWRERAELFAKYQAAADKVQALGRLPWIGFGLKYRLAQMFGVDVVKPDPHTRRIAARHGCTARELCEHLAAKSSLTAAAIQQTIWTASVAGHLDSHTGELKGLRDEKTPPRGARLQRPRLE